MKGFEIKTSEDIKKMQEGGAKLSLIKKELANAVSVGVSAYEIEELALKLIEESGGEASFKMVPRYHWATCINVNEGIVHGIPKKDLIFSQGDVVSIDVGLFYKGFHTDTSISVLIGKDIKKQQMLEAGQNALTKAIAEAKVGNFVYDISSSIEKAITGAGYTPVRALVGHGVGRNLHEEPAIPCFTVGKRQNTPQLPDGATIAIEVMYTQGSADLVLEEDGWTIATSDGKISALYEDTVAVTKNGPVNLTG